MKPFSIYIILFSLASFSWAQNDTLSLANIKRPTEGLKPNLGTDKYMDFGVEIPINQTYNITLNKSSKELYSKVLKIESEDARSLNLLLEDMNLDNFTAFEISNEKKQILGPYSKYDLTKNGNFLSWPLEGNTLYLRFYSNKASSIQFYLRHIVYGLTENLSRSFGQSGACNVNINCPEGTGWQTEKRSVVMLLNGAGTRYCTGALVNNTAEDGRPYILTARHCNVSGNSSFMFNYESPDCSLTDGPTFQTIQGADLKASWSVSDFTLIEMHNPPPASYFAYYSGWDKSGTLPDSATGIHHPRGDIKKISKDYDLLADSCYVCPNPNLDYWLVRAWDLGTTEPASSGSPLFDRNHRIIGQLRGGQATCVNSINDYYGKFSVSWEGGGTPDTRLKDWLDPMGVNPNFLDGKSSINPNPNASAKVSYFKGSSTYQCNDSTTLYFGIINTGNIPINKVCAKFDGVNPTICKQGNWYFGDEIILQTEYTNLKPSINTLNVKARIEMANGDTIEFDTLCTIERVPGATLQIETQYDLYPTETIWYVINSKGDTLMIENGAAVLPSDKTIREVCLPDDCYTLRIKDSGNDGICCAFGSGYIKVKDANGNVVFETSKFSSEASWNFCFPFAKYSSTELYLFPNPSVDYVNVLVPQKFADKDLELLVTDLLGRIVIKKPINTKYLHTFDVTNWAKGVYIFYVKDKKNKAFAKFVKN